MKKPSTCGERFNGECRDMFRKFLAFSLATFILFASSASWCIGESSSGSEESKDKARVASAKDEQGRAIDSLTREIEQDRNNADLYFRRALAYHARGDKERGDYASAIYDYTKALEMPPPDPSKRLYWRRADAYAEEGDQKAAIEDYTRAIEAEPETPDLYADRGTAYFKTDKYKQAEEDYLKAIQLNPEGRAGQMARKNLALLKKALEQQANAHTPLTQDDVDRLNAMEKEWGANIDRAVPFIRQKKYPAASAYLQNAADVISEIRELLIKKGYKPGANDRLTAMDLLTGAYMDMARIAAYAESPQTIGNNFQAIRALFDDARKKLSEAKVKFHEMPPLQELCRQFLDTLDDFERDIKRAMP